MAVRCSQGLKRVVLPPSSVTPFQIQSLLTELPLSGEKKDFEVYSCHVSPDGTRLVTAAGGELGISECNLCMKWPLAYLFKMAMYEYGPQKLSTEPVTLRSINTGSWPL